MAALDALQAWRALLGETRVLNDPATLHAYAASTSSCSTQPLAVIRPRNTDEVQRAVRIAAEHGVPLYPVSTGRNWGYGDACAPTNGQVIVDLGGMNRIREADGELAYAVIEPGVTQQQLSDFLRDQQLPLWMDSTGAGPDTSYDGNILERGFGHSPYGNRLQHVAGMEVVLASGELLRHRLRPLSRRAPTTRVSLWDRPIIDGMFTQSNMGIVTRSACG
jgi:4-cresol dehydrogenase (hydroxylating)